MLHLASRPARATILKGGASKTKLLKISRSAPSLARGNLSKREVESIPRLTPSRTTLSRRTCLLSHSPSSSLSRIATTQQATSRPPTSTKPSKLPSRPCSTPHRSSLKSPSKTKISHHLLRTQIRYLNLTEVPSSPSRPHLQIISQLSSHVDSRPTTSQINSQ